MRLNKRNVIDLIASNAIWRDNGALAIRELLQNAVEACRYRQHHSSPADAYEPKVFAVFNRQLREVVVVDNGCGMTERVVLNNLLTVGSSRSIEPGYSSAGYAPIARFGVGFWSVFTLAQSAHVETASFEAYRGDRRGADTADGIAFDVSLAELREYTVFRSIKHPCGTAVKLHLRDDVVIDDIFANAQRQILCSEIPVSFRIDDQEITFPSSVPNVPDEVVIGNRKIVLHQHEIKLFHWRGRKGPTEISLLIAYRFVDGKPTYLIDEHTSLLQVLPGLRSPRSAVCGFEVPLRTKHICFDLSRVGTYFANRTTPAGIAFSLDRRQLIENSASEQFALEVTDLVHDGYRAFLDRTNGRDLATVAALRTQAAMHGGNTYDTFTSDELLQAVRRFPDLYPFKLYPMSSDPIYVSADRLDTVIGKGYFVQQRLYAKFPHGMVSYDTEGEPGARLVQQIINGRPDTQGPVYVMEADRSCSWLFDADDESTVLFAESTAVFENSDLAEPLAIQVVDFERLETSRPAEVLVEVHGRWSGAIYLRDFERPNCKPYLFLGRHRVLIKRSSKLALHCQQLADAGRRVTLAELVADLQEDNEGYPSNTLAALLA